MEYSNSDHLLSGIEIMASFLLVITIMTIISYCISRRMRRPLPGVLRHQDTIVHDDGGEDVKARGLDDAALEGFPKLVYSRGTEYNKVRNYSTALSCSVCLGDYNEKDVLRMLPDCGHVFHLHCVDSWLRLHPTCPICRKLPSPSTSTPDDSCAVSIQIC